MNGSVSIVRNTSTALSTALSPSQGVELCAARPWTVIRIASTPLAWMPMCRSVGSPVIAKSARVGPACWATNASVERSSSSSDSSSGTHTSCTVTASWSARSCSAHSIAASPPFMS